MNLVQALRLSNFPTVAFVGAGGKSTTMFQLARELQPPVIVSATTHLGTWQIPLADRHIIATSPTPLEKIEHSLSGVILVTGEIEADRTKPLDHKTLLWLREFCGYYSMPLLIEADGSRQKPLKAPNKHEPPIPDFVKTVILVAGLNGLDKPLDETYIHRPEIFGRLSGLKPGDPVTASALLRVLTHPEGGLKNIPENARRVVLLNQADSPVLQSQAEAIAQDLLSDFQAVVIASLKDEQIHAVHESIAGIILAAGEAHRFGKPKQLLDWRGEPFVRAVAKTALESDLSPVIVVTGAYAEQVKATVQDLPVQIAHNAEWKSGQASSIRTGLGTLSQNLRFGRKNWEGIGGGIFLLADQPQVTPTLIQALVEEHASSLDPIVAPLVLDQRANPVLFDRVAFPDLVELEGDVGGRGIFSKHRVSYLPWHDDAMLLDVDTPEHYQRLKDLLE